MILVTLTVLAAITVGIVCERRTNFAAVVARSSLSLMLYVLVPFVAYTGFSHIHLTLGAGLGLVLAWFGICAAGLIGWAGARRLGLSSPVTGAIICVVVMGNTGFLGLPMTLALLGSGALPHSIAYDQAVSAPALSTLGFAIGAAFGTQATGALSARDRIRSFLLRNPPLWGVIAGLLVPKALAPHVLLSISHVVVTCELVLGFYAVGVYLSSERREDNEPLFQRPDRRVLLALAVRFLVSPGLMLIWLLLGIGIPTAYVLEAAMPSGVTCLLVGNLFGLDQQLIATVILWGTIVALIVGLAVHFS